MSAILECLQFCCGACRIALYTLYKKLCCKKSPPPRPEFAIVCVGLSNVGKSTLLCLLANERTDNIQPTSGFSIKAVQFRDAILNIKEIGGGEKVRPYWKHYYKGAQGIVFVLDAGCSEDELEDSSSELHNLLGDPNLSGVPCLILANCTDKPSARAPDDLKRELFDLENVCAGRPWIFHTCNYKDIVQIQEGFEKLAMILLNREKGEFTDIDKF